MSDIDEYTKICQTIYGDSNGKWFLFEHGTVIVTKNVSEVTDEYVLKIMRDLSERIGPYGGEGGEYGDCGAQQLRKFDGWVVNFSVPVVTLVLASELGKPMKTSPTEVMQAPTGFDPVEFANNMRIALIGRSKRNRDCAQPKIVGRGVGVPKAN